MKRGHGSIYERYIKRAIDILLSLIALVVLSLPMLAVFVLVRIKLGRPAVFTQRRAGYKCRSFTLRKFRSMTDERDAHGVLLPDADRLTKFGRFLRSTSLDELPQLLNILAGEMSIIGPRPLPVEYVPLYDGEQLRRHDVRPGIVGLAGVNGRNAQTWASKFRYDLEYVDNVSFALDCRIFFGAILTVFKRNGIDTDTEAAKDDPFQDKIAILLAANAAATHNDVPRDTDVAEEGAAL